jgi:hypothetical protein
MVQDVRRWLLDDFLSRKITSNIPNLKTKKEETIMRKNKMTITISSLIGIFLIAALILVPAAQAGKKTMKFKYTSQITKVEFTPVPDVKGHIVGLYERRGVAIFENEVAAFTTMGTLDFIKGQGPFQGYSQITFKDGSIFIYNYTGTLTLAPGAKLRSYKGKGKFVKGAGRFEGIKGEVSFTGRYITPITKDKTKGDNWMEMTGTYTLPKK